MSHQKYLVGQDFGDSAAEVLSPQAQPETRPRSGTVTAKAVAAKAPKQVWTSVIPKLTVLVVSRDYNFTTLISQMVLNLGGTPVVATSADRTAQILQHRLKYATDVVIIVHQSECVATVASLDTLVDEGEKQKKTQEPPPPGVVEESVAQHAAALEYQPWYDVASRVRHVAAPDSSEEENSLEAPVVITMVVVLTDGIYSPDSTPVSPLSSSALDNVLSGDMVVSLAAPFSRADFATALCHMRNHAKASTRSKNPPDMSEMAVLSICENTAQQSATAGALRKSNIDNIFVDSSQLATALMLQAFDTVVLQDVEKKVESKPWYAIGRKLQADDSATESILGALTSLQQDLSISLPTVVITQDASSETRDSMMQNGASQVIVAPFDERAIAKAVGSKLSAPPRNRNRNQVHKEAESTQGNIKSTDGQVGSKIHKKRKSIVHKSIRPQDLNLQSREVKRRGSWSSGWVSLVSSDTLTCAVSRGAVHHVPQDRIKIMEDYGCKGHKFFGVFDGHGPEGAPVATFVGDTLSKVLLMEKAVSMDDSSADWEAEMEMAIRRSCQVTIELLIEKTTENVVNALESGCTASFGIVTPSRVFVGNVGDSRTCYVRRNPKGKSCFCFGSSIDAGAISVDHTPSDPSEAERVKREGALVVQMGPVLRVVHPGLSGKDLRGLAMSRSFGDLWASDIGVVAEPEFFVHHLNEDDRYILCASDGIWDVLTVDEVAAALPESTSSANAQDLSAAVKGLVEDAVHRWGQPPWNADADDTSLVVISL